MSCKEHVLQDMSYLEDMFLIIGVKLFTHDIIFKKKDTGREIG